MLTRHEMAHKMFSVAIPCPLGQKSKMAAKIQQKISFLCITMRIIDLAGKCLCTKWESLKNATFSFFNQLSSSKTVEVMSNHRSRTGVADAFRRPRKCRNSKMAENLGKFLTVTHVKILFQGGLQFYGKLKKRYFSFFKLKNGVRGDSAEHGRKPVFGIYLERYWFESKMFVQKVKEHQKCYLFFFLTNPLAPTVCFLQPI